MSSLFSRKQVVLFAAVGGVAAVVHWGVAVSLVSSAQLEPLAANAMGWLVAFWVSFAGQSTWTFRGHEVPFSRAARRYFVLSCGGFLINEAAYALLLHWSRMRYDVLLAAVLFGVAGLTFILSRAWAFQRSRPPDATAASVSAGD